jgi:hypothetical protein
MAAPAGSIEEGMGRHAGAPLPTPAEKDTRKDAKAADDQRLAVGLVRYEWCSQYLILPGMSG